MAAGRSRRFGEGLKQYASLGGEPVLRRALRAFTGHPRVQKVLAVIAPEDHAEFAEASRGLPVLGSVTGGATRQESVRLGLEALAMDPPDLVLIHDGARPLVGTATIDAVLNGLDRANGAIPALPVTDTLKQVREDGGVGVTLPRAGVVRAQTPQGFRFAPILAAHRTLAGQELTDDAAVLERAGHYVTTVPGDETNVKVTTTDDLARLNASLRTIRVGQGFDTHRFGPGDAVMLCGVKVPHPAKLLGHSDADVGLHAATDAILGAIGAGDIGLHFPPTDAAYKGVSSDRFLRRAHELLVARGGELVHLDITIICERPKVSPHRDAMVATVAGILGVPPDRVSVKGTTSDGLGFTGRGEGIAAQAVATVRL